MRHKKNTTVLPTRNILNKGYLWKLLAHNSSRILYYFQTQNKQAAIRKHNYNVSYVTQM